MNLYLPHHSKLPSGPTRRQRAAARETQRSVRAPSPHSQLLTSECVGLCDRGRARLVEIQNGCSHAIYKTIARVHDAMIDE